MKFIIGKKIEMTQLWKDEQVVAVTKVQAGPCLVAQVRNEEKDGYKAVQLGFGERKAKNINKPQLGHFKKAGQNFSAVREFRLDRRNKEENAEFNIGDKIDVSTFSAGDIIQVTGTSKGKGFQGVVKRHGFSGGRKTHGNKDQLRMPGSVSATGVGHVFKGTRMGGRMGGDRITTINLEVAEVDLANNLLYIKGAVPGARNSLVLIEGQGELKIVKPTENKTEEVTVEEPKAEEIKTAEAAVEAPKTEEAK
jgi:large subunit ribosomal protein L3